jgi:hypothetical protein
MDPDLNSLIAQSKQKLDEGGDAAKEAASSAGTNLQDLIEKSKAKLASAVPNPQAPSWYDSIVAPVKHMFTPLTDEEWQQKVEATKQPGEQMRAEVERIQSSPWELAKFAGRSALGLGGQYAGGALGFSPAAAAATPLARTGIGAAAGGVQAGTDALAHGASLGEAAGDTIHGAIFGGGLDAAHAVAGGLGGATKGAANRKLAERALSSGELNDVRAEGGGQAVSQAGQNLRDLGLTKARGLLDYFRGNTPERMSENSVGILDSARKELDRSTKAITSAPARDVSVMSNDPKPVTVGQAPVDVSPINDKLHGQADALDYAKNPDKAKTYRNLASELTTPAQPRAPRPNASYEPVAESRAPETPDAPVSQLPLESRMPEQPPDPGALSSEPVDAPIEHNAPPMSSQPVDDGNLLDIPPAGPADNFDHRANTYRANTPEVDKTPILDLEPPPSTRNLDPSSQDLTSPFKDLGPKSPEPQTRPFWNPIEMPNDNAFNLLGHDMQNLPARTAGPSVGRFGEVPPAPGKIEADTSYWPAPYEMSRNEPPMPPQEAGLPPARSTVLEHTPRFQGNSPGPGLELDQPRQDFQPDNLLAPTALYPDNPPPPQGEMAPLGMSRRAPIVGPIQHTGTAQGSRPPASDLAPGPAEPLDVPETSPGPIDTGRFPETPRPMTPADPSTGFTTEQLMAMRRELGNQTRNFQGRPLNKTEGDMNAATRDAWKGAGDALTGALDKHVEAGNLTPDVVDSYRDANKTFSTIADVNKNLASRTNQDFKTPSSTGNETMLGSGYKATERAKQRVLGLNAQYGIGQGLEAAGNAAQAGSDLARMGAGLGWNQNRQDHPEITKAQQDNPQAPKAEVEQKANDSMKDKLMGAWYNVLGAFHQ